jgi:hypothetical protein
MKPTWGDIGFAVLIAVMVMLIVMLLAWDCHTLAGT